MKKIMSWLLKAFVSGLIASAALTVFCFIYYNVPVHTETADGATDYAWEYNKFYARATEGFAYGRTNNEGYLNLIDYSDNKNIDILVMGSSHMEAYQVSLKESTAGFLANYFPDDTVYNIGTSGHDFLVCADNFSAAMAKYKPTKYVLLETTDIFFTDDELISAINETVPDIPSHSGGIVGMLQKNQFIRLLYVQIKSFANKAAVEDNSNISSTATVEYNFKLYDDLLAKLADTVSQNGAQLIILYHTRLNINKDGSATYSDNAEFTANFSDLCKNNDILFLDMRDPFVKHYEETHQLPHGFGNTSIGRGHLNKHGHEWIAHAVYDLIKENT